MPTPLPIIQDPQPAATAAARPFRIAMMGNPNAGKTTLFNALTGLRAKTANFPGTTVEHKRGMMRIDGFSVELVDLPGMYSLQAATPEEHISRDVFLGNQPGIERPDAALMVVDATNLERNLFLVSQVLEHDRPVIVALNMTDIAHQHGLHVNEHKLSLELGCPVVAISAKTGKGIPDLQTAVRTLVDTHLGAGVVFHQNKPACQNCAGCPFQARFDWTEDISKRVVKEPITIRDHRTEALDQLLTHPVFGILAFFLVMASMFFLIFQVASVPMAMIDHIFATMGSFMAEHLPEGDFRSLVVDGIIGGVGGILIFLPQICILFFFLTLLEDTGYLARAAFVMDRLMRRIGLPGKAFVPLLSAHACAIPAIMATRVIDDKRDRLVTILVAPLMTCSARIPVYSMVVALIFPHDPLKAALTFTGSYALGITAALAAAFLFKRTILPGESKPLVIELPHYRLPSIRSALLHMTDRALIFVKQAGTGILVISIILWCLATYPKSSPPPEAVQMTAQAETLAASGAEDEAAALLDQADHLTGRHQLANSFAGRMGRFVEPVLAPLGFDWQIGIGIISSFAAREVIVSTLAIVYGVGADRADEDANSLYDTLRTATRADGSPVFGVATCMALLVFYVLAAQCLPTQVITKRETKSWKWPLFQIAYMTILAYTAALITFQVLKLLGHS